MDQSKSIKWGWLQKGLYQQAGFYFNKTFSLTIDLTTIRIVSTLALSHE